MSLGTVRLGELSVSRFILGGNPFSGHAHSTPAGAEEMRSYYTAARIKQTLREAEAVGVNTFIGRTDAHIVRLLHEYWDEGGTIQWIAQTAPELASLKGAIGMGLKRGAKACFIHGGTMEFSLANDNTAEIVGAVEQVRAAGVPVGVAGHKPSIFQWAEDNLDVDFYMCCHYYPSMRDKRAELHPGQREVYLAEDRRRMVEQIATLSKPAIHYKILAAGRNDPAEAFAFVAKHLRPQDAVCVGVYPKDNPDMVADDVRMLEEALAAESRITSAKSK